MKKIAGTLILIVLVFTVHADAQTAEVGAINAASGTAEMDRAPITIGSEQFHRIVSFHGHSCAGLAMGVRVAQAAARELGGKLDPYNLVAIVETNRCPVDAIQVLLHTTAGKQNLVYQGHNRNVFTFVRRPDGTGVRITVKDNGWGKSDPVFESLRTKKISGKATPEEVKKFEEMMNARASAILAAPEAQLLTIESVKVAVPPQN
ncbi:MAG TPA: FmdE family protein [Pyrinomonadaceae bacterium]|nr:FmdE family protein [Pyrinomonadaceae bacterium]